MSDAAVSVRTLESQPVLFVRRELAKREEIADAIGA